MNESVSSKRLLDALVKSLLSATESGDVKTVKNLLVAIEDYSEIFPGANIAEGITAALIVASKNRNQKIILMLSGALANVNDGNAENSEDKNSNFDDQATDVEDQFSAKNSAFSSAKKLLGSALKYVTDEDSRDKAKDVIKNNAESLGVSLQEFGKKAKESVSNMITKENIDAVGEKIKSNAHDTSVKVKEKLQDSLLNILFIDMLEELHSADSDATPTLDQFMEKVSKEAHAFWDSVVEQYDNEDYDEEMTFDEDLDSEDEDKIEDNNKFSD